MKRLLAVVAVALGSALYAVVQNAEPALACSGPGPVENMLDAQVILEGRISSVEPTAAEDPYWQRIPMEMTFEVARGHRGVEAGQQVTALAFIPGDAPVMCPQFDRDPASLVGKYVVIGLLPPIEGDTRLLADAWVVSFMGDSPSGTEYQDGVRLAEMIADSSPAGPKLTVVGGTATCGAGVRFSGERFPAGRYLVRVPFASRVLGSVDVGASGSIDESFTFIDGVCRQAQFDGRRVSFHIDALAGHSPSVWLDFDALTEIATATIAGATDRQPPWPELAVSPDPARCDGSLAIRGHGFEPSELLSITVGGDSVPVTLTTDHAGNFETVTRVPSGACEGPVIGIAVRQGGFEALLALPPLAETYIGRAETTPGPPDAGTGTIVLTTTHPTIPWRSLVMVAILLMAFAGGTVAIVRSVRRR